MGNERKLAIVGDIIVTKVNATDRMVITDYDEGKVWCINEHHKVYTLPHGAYRIVELMKEDAVLQFSEYQWYSKNGRVCYYVGDQKGTGFNIYGKWQTDIYMDNSERWELADDETVKKLLLKHAAEFYGEDVKYISAGNKKETSSGEFSFFNLTDDASKVNKYKFNIRTESHTLSSGCVIYSSGGWSKIDKPEYIALIENKGSAYIDYGTVFKVITWIDGCPIAIHPYENDKTLRFIAGEWIPATKEQYELQNSKIVKLGENKVSFLRGVITVGGESASYLFAKQLISSMKAIRELMGSYQLLDSFKIDFKNLNDVRRSVSVDGDTISIGCIKNVTWNQIQKFEEELSKVI